MMRVLLVANVPTPYNIPPLERIKEDSGWLLTVCYISTSNQDIGWAEELLDPQVAHETLVLDRQRPRLKWLLGSQTAATASLLEKLRRERPDYLIIYGYTRMPQVAAMAWAAATGTPFAVLGDANLYADCAVGMRRMIKRFWLRQVTERAAALITVGTTNRMFWESYGARPEKTFESHYAVDNDFFARGVARRQSEATALRERLGLAGKVVFLYVGRLVGRKGIDLLIHAVKSLAEENVAVAIAGGGPERAALEALTGGDPRVVFVGRVAYAELPLYYALADALVLPSRHEPWGLVINEAMASGLAVIAHHHCGAAVDLVGPDNGVALESFSVAELAEAMRLIAADGERRRAMQARSVEKIQQWSIQAFAHGIIRAVQTSARPRLAPPVISELGKLK